MSQGVAWIMLAVAGLLDVAWAVSMKVERPAIAA